MAGNIRDGTGRYCFDMLGGKMFEDGTGRGGKIMKIIVAWMGRDGTVVVNFLDGTGLYHRTMTFLFHDGTGRQIRTATTGQDGKEKCHDGTGR